MHETRLQRDAGRRKNKLDKLRLKYDNITQQYEQALILYHTEVKESEKLTGKVITEFIFELKQITEKTRILNKNERKSLQAIMQADLDLLFQILPHKDIPEDIKLLYKELFGEDSEESFRAALTEFNNEFKELSGLDGVDFSNFHPDEHG